jgi:hypothetical protein
MVAEFIMVPVPRERVQEVYRLLASDPMTSDSASADQAGAEDGAPWTNGEIARAYRESPERMKRFLDYLASMAGRPATSAETAQAVDYSPHQQAGMLGAFGHRVRSRYGKPRWFFAYEWSEQREAWAYSMGESAARVIRDLKR